MNQDISSLVWLTLRSLEFLTTARYLCWSSSLGRCWSFCTERGRSCWEWLLILSWSSCPASNVFLSSCLRLDITWLLNLCWGRSCLCFLLFQEMKESGSASSCLKSCLKRWADALRSESRAASSPNFSSTTFLCMNRSLTTTWPFKSLGNSWLDEPRKWRDNDESFSDTNTVTTNHEKGIRIRTLMYRLRLRGSRLIMVTTEGASSQATTLRITVIYMLFLSMLHNKVVAVDLPLQSVVATQQVSSKINLSDQTWHLRRQSDFENNFENKLAQWRWCWNIATLLLFLLCLLLNFWGKSVSSCLRS